MKAYGVPRRSQLTHPDLQDALDYGMPSRVQKQKSKRKRAVRRNWKKKERASARRDLTNEQLGNGGQND